PQFDKAITRYIEAYLYDKYKALGYTLLGNQPDKENKYLPPQQESKANAILNRISKILDTGFFIKKLPRKEQSLLDLKEKKIEDVEFSIKDEVDDNGSDVELDTSFEEVKKKLREYLTNFKDTELWEGKSKTYTMKVNRKEFTNVYVGKTFLTIYIFTNNEPIEGVEPLENGKGRIIKRVRTMKDFNKIKPFLDGAYKRRIKKKRKSHRSLFPTTGDMRFTLYVTDKQIKPAIMYSSGNKYKYKECILPKGTQIHKDKSRYYNANETNDALRYHKKL
ncbi:MAG: hypothetical protein ACFFDN_45765, partial [Candidatus Hodarchaeota archaeon]